MKKFTSSFIILFSISVFSQSPADKWFFGLNSALSFSGNATPTVVLASAMFASEGCSSISDAGGNLLFYTNGLSVWNKNHLVMSNGAGLLGGASATQAALIVPLPGSNSTYYIFTVDDQGGTNSLRYSIVDMTLGAGNGSVTVKNATLQTTAMAEKLCGVKDPFNNRYWIAAHEFGSNKFFVYEMNNAGLQPPVVTNIGTVHSNSVMQNCYGQMKFNGCGTKLGVAIGYQNAVDLFDFNTNTGVVSNPMWFPLPAHVYGLEFSSESKMMYVSTYDATQTLEQFNISSNNYTVIAGTQTTIANASGLSIYPLQLGPDKKIYVNKSNDQWLGVINTPSATGNACNYVDLAIDLDPGSTGKNAAQSLPAFISSYFNTATCPNTSGINEINLSENFLIYPNPALNEFNLKTENKSVIEIFSYTGALIEKINCEEGKLISFGKNYARGIYFVKVNSEKVLKIIKE